MFWISGWVSVPDVECAHLERAEALQECFEGRWDGFRGWVVEAGVVEEELAECICGCAEGDVEAGEDVWGWEDDECVEDGEGVEEEEDVENGADVGWVWGVICGTEGEVEPGDR